MCEAIIVECCLDDEIVGTEEALEKYPEFIALDSLITLDDVSDDSTDNEGVMDGTDGEFFSDGQLADRTAAAITLRMRTSRQQLKLAAATIKYI